MTLHMTLMFKLRPHQYRSEIYWLIGMLLVSRYGLVSFPSIRCSLMLFFLDVIFEVRLQKQFPILRTRIFPDLYPLIYPRRRSLVLGRRILIPGSIWSPPNLVVYGVPHSLPLGVHRDFHSVRMRLEGIFHTSLALSERVYK